MSDPVDRYTNMDMVESWPEPSDAQSKALYALSEGEKHARAVAAGQRAYEAFVTEVLETSADSQISREVDEDGKVYFFFRNQTNPNYRTALTPKQIVKYYDSSEERRARALTAGKVAYELAVCEEVMES